MTTTLLGDRELPESRYDLSTYWGRVRHTSDVINPRSLLAGQDGVDRAKQLIETYKRGEVREISEELWRAKAILDSTLHPDTGSPIVLPFRMSCFVLSGLPITALMLSPGIGTMGTIVGQVLNQSLNVAVNYCNANESSRLSRSKLVQSYLLAIAASCSVAVGFSSAISRIRSLPPNARVLLGRFAPFAAVASAGFLNVFLVRGEELRKGIDIFPLKSHPRSPETLPTEETGAQAESLGKSKKAALVAVSETAFSRVLNCAPIMILPPLALFGLQKTRWLRQNPRMAFPINLGLITVTSFAALPLALAAFPQRQSISAKSLEPEFHGLGDKDGMVAFSRGI